MATSDDVIKALDTPVDLVTIGETEDEKAAGRAEQSPTLLGVIWNVSLYIILAVVLFGLVRGQI